MNRYRRILVATDMRLKDQSIVDEAVGVAKKNDASLKLVDVVPSFTLPVRLLLDNHEHLRDLMIREKQEQLDALAIPIREQGIEVETKVLNGKTSVEIIREVLRDRHDLVMRVAKGHQSRRSGYFGTTGTRLLRDCPCAVHLVAHSANPEYCHVLACIDTSTNDPTDEELNHKVLDAAKAIGEHYGATLSVAQAWVVHAEAILESRMPPHEFDEMGRERHQHVEKMLSKFLQQRGEGIDEKRISVIKGEASDVIPKFIKDNKIDLVVMGTVGRSGAAGLIMGNTAEQILGSIECSVFAVKPRRFISPIKMDEYVSATI